jgi:ATP-dependent DNA helicase PIF1
LAEDAVAQSNLKPAQPLARGLRQSTGLDAARDYIANGRGHLFVTGRAGTGKSTLLRSLDPSADNGMVVVAPTGLAAVQVGGQTIHSFFGLPPRLIKPEDIRPSRKLALMKKLKTLVIDEVSMVRADLMDGIDRSLRLNRKKPNVPFGGVRVLLFGDLHQLPPVVQDSQTRDHLNDTYGGPFFFDAPGFRDAESRLVELDEVFRQNDPVFVDALNGIRDGAPDKASLDVINTRVIPLEDLGPKRGSYVILTPTNQVANEINLSFLTALKGRSVTLEAAVTGTYSDSAQPNDSVLVLKEGAKVVMLRNDPDKRWVNGTLATIAKIDGDTVSVDIDGEEYEVEPATWESIRYEYDAKEDRIVEQVVGTFKQLPLRLAWALTIHKSQGMTLDRVYIDLRRGTFAHGQAYVALSRCRTLEGLALARPLHRWDIVFDQAATGYRDRFTPV